MLQGLEQVAAAVGSLATETRSLAKEVRIENRERGRQIVLQMVLTGLVLVVLVLLVVQVFRQDGETRDRSRTASEQRRSQLALAQQINDCITPDGECFKRNQAAQAAALQRLIDTNVHINRCTVEADGDVAAFDACLKARGVTVVAPTSAAR